MPDNESPSGVEWTCDEQSRSAIEVETATEEVIRCIRDDDPAGVNKAIDSWSPEDLADLVVHMPLRQARIFLDWLPRRKAGRVLADMHPENRASLSQAESEELLGELLEEMPPEEALDTFQSLPKRMQDRVARELSDLETIQVAREYPEGTAGFIMEQRFLAVPPSSTASEVIVELKKSFEFTGTTGTVYVVDIDDAPIGVFRPRELLVIPRDTSVSEIMRKDFPIVHADASQEEAAHAIEQAGYMSLPVVDGEGHLIGQVTPKLRERILAEEQRRGLLRMASVSPFARATDGAIQIVRGRLPWLLAGLIGATVAAFVIGSFEEELEKAAILAAFIPVVMSMAGNSGLQAAGVSVQVLASGTLWPGDRLISRLLRELYGALSNGAIAGVILAAMVIISSGIFDIENASRLALAVSLSLISVTTVAALVGASTPFALNRFGVDPAAATGVFITTSNDVLGVLVYFTMAGVFYF